MFSEKTAIILKAHKAIYKDCAAPMVRRDPDSGRDGLLTNYGIVP
jgi:hypothetical protein